MKVSEAIKILQDMPQGAVLVGHSESMRDAEVGRGMLRPGAHSVEEGAILAGFTAEEIKREGFEFFLWEKEGLVVLGLVTRSDGEEV